MKTERASIATRTAREGDAVPICALLNAIIARGGTTAHVVPFTPADIDDHFIRSPRLISCTVATEGDAVAGFQHLEWCDPHWSGPAPLPADWAVIATFVAPAMQGKGIGTALWEVTREAGRRAGVTAIDATIRADNAGGLGYYAARGFRDHALLRDIALRNGQRVDLIRKKFDFRGGSGPAA